MLDIYEDIGDCLKTLRHFWKYENITENPVLQKTHQHFTNHYNIIENNVTEKTTFNKTLNHFRKIYNISGKITTLQEAQKT